MATTMAPAKAPEARAEVARPVAREFAPFDLMRQWTREMDHFFPDFFGRRTLPRIWRGETATWIPDIEMQDADGMLTLRADLPGLASTDVKVEILDGVLTITGERKQEKKEEKAGGYFVSERTYGRFERQVTLPDGVKEEEAKATFKDGVLEVRMPHAEARARTPHTVPVV